MGRITQRDSKNNDETKRKIALTDALGSLPNPTEPEANSVERQVCGQSGHSIQLPFKH
jgi:hypothetical protein